mgnify:CR=1 FL=1
MVFPEYFQQLLVGNLRGIVIHFDGLGVFRLLALIPDSADLRKLDGDGWDDLVLACLDLAQLALGVLLEPLVELPLVLPPAVAGIGLPSYCGDTGSAAGSCADNPSGVVAALKSGVG